MEYLVWCIALSEISPLFEDIKHCMDIPNNEYFIVISLSPRDGLLVRSIDTARITLSEISRERVLWYLSKYLEDYWEFVFNRDIAMLISPFWYWYIIIPLKVRFLERDITLISNESLERERERSQERYCLCLERKISRERERERERESVVWSFSPLSLSSQERYRYDTSKAW